MRGLLRMVFLGAFWLLGAGRSGAPAAGEEPTKGPYPGPPVDDSKSSAPDTPTKGAADGSDAPGHRLDKTNSEAAERVRRTVAKEGPDLASLLRGLQENDVVVVGGLFDFTQEILKAFGVKHRVLTPAELEHLAIDAPERMVFFLNCHLMDRKFPASQTSAPRPDRTTARARLERELKAAGLDGPSAPGQAIRKRFEEVMFFAGSEYSVAGLKKLGAAVRAGAWVVSMDWAILALERAFPKTIRWTGHTTFEETIPVKLSAAGRRHSLMRGVFPAKQEGRPAPKPKWWLEAESYLFRLTTRHTTLVESQPLAARYHGHRKVVVLFEPGKGRVLHALAHGYLQSGRAGDAAVMQRLLLNFLLEKSLQNWRRPAAKDDKSKRGKNK